MALYNTGPAEDTRLQEAPKSWKLKKIVVVSAALSFSLGACAATALSYREVGASRATQLVAQTDCQAKYPNLCSDDGCNCRCPPWNPSTPSALRARTLGAGRGLRGPRHAPAFWTQ